MPSGVMAFSHGELKKILLLAGLLDLLQYTTSLYVVRRRRRSHFNGQIVLSTDRPMPAAGEGDVRTYVRTYLGKVAVVVCVWDINRH